MPDYGRPLQFGSFVTPGNAEPLQVVELAQLSEQLGLDLITFSDHPYQSDYLDTWTLMSYVAARTSTIGLSGNVINLPLRPPAVLARSVASLDLLSGGRVDLGLGAGAFWDAIEAMGGRRLSPGDAVRALDEAITIIREVWSAETRGGVRVDGEHYRVAGAKRGPSPAHPVGIWLGAYKPRMLRLTGRRADGWLPSESYLQPGDLARASKIIDDAATAAGRDPAEVRRLLNLSSIDADHLVELALTDGIDTFIVMSDDPVTMRRFALVAEEVQARVDAARQQRAGRDGTGQDGTGQDSTGQDSTGQDWDGARSEEPKAPRGDPEQPAGGDPDQRAGGEAADPTAAEYRRLGIRVTHDDGARLSATWPWDESTRPRRQPGPPTDYPDHGRFAGKHLVDIHDQLRTELSAVRDLIDQVRAGRLSAPRARAAVNELTMRQNDWTLGAYCASYCSVVAQHHGLEDQAVFPWLRRQADDLGPILDRLTEEHHVIHEVLEDIDRRLVGVIDNPGSYDELTEAVNLLSDALLSHLAYEEQQLVEPLARYGFAVPGA